MKFYTQINCPYFNAEFSGSHQTEFCAQLREVWSIEDRSIGTWYIGSYCACQSTPPGVVAQAELGMRWKCVEIHYKDLN